MRRQPAAVEGKDRPSLRSLREKSVKWVPWVVFALFGLYLVGNNFHAKLGIIDDHEIAMFLGDDGRISLSDVPKAILGTEVGQWGTFPRYRPSYYTLKVFETVLWRDSGMLWYVSRYVMLCIGLFLGWTLLCRYFPQIIAYLVVFYALTMPFWPDILTRLGPSEIYAVPALLLFIYGLIKNKLWMLALGYGVCVGVKENFLILLPLLLAWAVYRATNKELTRKDLITTSLLVAYTLFIVGAILVATGRAGVDVYASEISYRGRIYGLIADIPGIIQERNMLPTIMVMLGGFVMSLRLWKGGGWRKLVASPIPRHLAVMAVVMAMIASQYVFYSNRLPSAMRYDFPCLLLFTVLDLVAFRMIIECFHGHKLQKLIKIVVYAGIVLICVVDIFRQGYSRIRTRAEINAAATQSFNVQLDQASEIIKKHPEATVIFVSERFFDYEPIVSVMRYFRTRAINNKYVLHYTPKKTLTHPLGRELQDILTAAMHGKAGADRSFDRFSPYETLKEPCYCITFRGAQGLAAYPTIATF